MQVLYPDKDAHARRLQKENLEEHIMKKSKRMLAAFLAILTLICCTALPASATTVEENTEAYLPDTAFESEEALAERVGEMTVMDEILAEHQEAIWDLTVNSTGLATAKAMKSTSISEIQENTVQALQDAGYEAYDVNPQSFEDMEDTLQTDLEDAGLSSDGSYVIIIGGEEDPTVISPQAVSSSFTHKYGGTNYTLRWMTIYTSDDPKLGQSTTVNLLDSTSRNLLINVLDTALSTYISSISSGLGTVASILGLSVESFFPSSRTTMSLTGSSNWTVRYTQVWSPQDKRYTNGCYVEDVATISTIGGHYYSAGLNRYTPFPSNPRTYTAYSSKYNDWAWRKDYAVRGYLTSSTYKNSVDKIEFRHGGSTKITHKHF